LSTSDPCFGKTIWQHLLITLTEGILAFLIGAVAGVALGFWLARNQMLSAVFEPYIKMFNALPRVVLAPIFMLWLGLGIWSKVAGGVTLVFFIVLRWLRSASWFGARLLRRDRPDGMALGATHGSLEEHRSLAEDEPHWGLCRRPDAGNQRCPGAGA